MNERQQLRAQLKSVRLAMSEEERRRARSLLRQHVYQLVIEQRWMSLGLYWPLPGEPDLRRLAVILRRQQIVTSLPWGVSRQAGVRYRRWQPDTPLAPDVWGVPAPLSDDEVQPQAILVPLPGFDRKGYRIGHGGGTFDRTLAEKNPPIAVGVGYERCRLADCQPEPHDKPMQWVITELGIFPT